MGYLQSLDIIYFCVNTETYSCRFFSLWDLATLRIPIPSDPCGRDHFPDSGTPSLLKVKSVSFPIFRHWGAIVQFGFSMNTKFWRSLLLFIGHLYSKFWNYLCLYSVLFSFFVVKLSTPIIRFFPVKLLPQNHAFSFLP